MRVSRVCTWSQRPTTRREYNSQTTKNQKKTGRIYHIKWYNPNYFPTLQKTINLMRAVGKKLFVNPISADGHIVPESTLQNMIKQLGEKEATYENCFPRSSYSLLSTERIQLLQNIVCCRDMTNTGMGRGEVIQIIGDLGQAKNFKTASNHLDYLIRSKKLNKLKRNGQVVTAQATTT